ncbi:MAG: 50S ribosomal protein L24 [Eubacteriales bacterium]|nr:50S ribosomal protein L24 [Eubacteriales bacterium]
MKSKVHVKKDDMVIVISGNDKGKRGKVLQVAPDEGKILVEGINLVKKHVKPRKQGQEGGILTVEGALYADKVMPYCSKCAKGVRIKHKYEGNKKIRICAKCGAEI